ncbi:MAG: NTP transferase domain-containing protein [Oscillospiraceae bacterium]|nr:NTP transferase domain-containing protein [Oscillospiraceae bacterium]
MQTAALILTGGDALRLRPLTCTKPAAMLPVCGVPLINYTLDLLLQHRFSQVFIAADRLSAVLTDHLEDSSADFIITDTPEGSAAAIANTAAETDADQLVVIFGNVLLDTDLTAALEVHRSASADISVLTREPVSSEDNILAVTDGDDITELIPCPARENCRSDTAVAGVFIISRETALAATESGSDLTEELIPAVIRRGGKVISISVPGYFRDVNTHEGYFSANADVLNGVYPRRPEHIVKMTADRPELDLVPPVYISDSADIAPGAEIGAGTVIGENVTVCRGAKLRGAVIMDGAFIGERVTAAGAAIGTGARLLSGAEVYEGAVIGDNAVIAEQAVVRSNVRIWNGRHIDAYSCAAQDIKYGFLAPMRIGEDGICGETGSIITPQVASAAGSSLASLGGRIAVGCKDNAASKALAMAVCAGVTSAGAEAWFFGECSSPALAYCTARSGLSAGCWVEAGVTAKLRLFSGDGLPLTRSEEKIIEGGLNRSEYRRAGFAHFGELRDTAAILRLYNSMLEELAPKKLTDIKAVLNTSGGTVQSVCDGILDRINKKEGDPIVFHIGSDGMGISAFTDETGYVFEEKLILIACMHRFSQGHDIALPNDFPKAADNIAEKLGRKVLRYSGCPSDKGDMAARRLAAETPFVHDGAALMLTVLDVLESRGITLPQAVRELPDLALSTRFVAIDKHPVKLLRSMFSQQQVSGDGVTINDKRGRVRIKPVRTEKGVMMQVESYSAETAAELCDFYQDMLVSKQRLLGRNEDQTNH